VIFGVDSRVAFTVLIGVIAAQRLLELRTSGRNMRALVARGGYEVGASHYPWMVALHSAFLVSCVAEVWLLDRPFRTARALPWLVVLVAALALRWWTLRSLGERWTTRVMVLPGAPLVTRGPYRWLRHPNYLVVVLELAAIPMLHGAWLTALLFGTANLALLARRIGAEEAALADAVEAAGPGVRSGS
jgi:methyltransferase